MDSAPHAPQHDTLKMEKLSRRLTPELTEPSYKDRLRELSDNLREEGQRAYYHANILKEHTIYTNTIQGDDLREGCKGK